MSALDFATVLAPPAQQSLSFEIASRLREAILNGHFGPGERLREEALATAMGVSRGPIREALVQLEREGLIVIRRNRGAFVARLSREDLEEVYTLRAAIERLAVARAAEFATPADISDLQNVVDEIRLATERGITEQEAAELDVRFHDLIYRIARHRRLYETWQNLRPQIHILLLDRNVSHADFRAYVVIAHQQIVDALRVHDTEGAIALIDDHMHGSYDRVAKHRDQESAGYAGERVRS